MFFVNQTCFCARPLVFDTTMSDTTPWEEYCEASLDLSNQDDVGDNELAAMETLYCFFEKYDKALKRLADS